MLGGWQGLFSLQRGDSPSPPRLTRARPSSQRWAGLGAPPAAAARSSAPSTRSDVDLDRATLGHPGLENRQGLGVAQLANLRKEAAEAVGMSALAASCVRRPATRIGSSERSALSKGRGQRLSHSHLTRGRLGICGAIQTGGTWEAGWLVWINGKGSCGHWQLTPPYPDLHPQPPPIAPWGTTRPPAGIRRTSTARHEAVRWVGSRRRGPQLRLAGHAITHPCTPMGASQKRAAAHSKMPVSQGQTQCSPACRW